MTRLLARTGFAAALRHRDLRLLLGGLVVSATGSWATRCWSVSTARPLATIGPGDYFGEIGLLERIPRTAAVVAALPTRLYRIGGQEFLDALTSSPPAGSVIEDVRTRLARTHPSHEPTYPVPAAPDAETRGRS